MTNGIILLITLSACWPSLSFGQQTSFVDLTEPESVTAQPPPQPAPAGKASVFLASFRTIAPRPVLQTTNLSRPGKSLRLPVRTRSIGAR